MKRRGKRLMALLLAMVMTVMLLPATAMAALGDLLVQDTAYNRQVLSALEGLVGEGDAQACYRLLQQYNLLDEDGRAVEDWSVTMDGRELGLDQLREVLAGDYDPERLVWVDGVPVTLENLDLILQIEDYIAYLDQTYFSDGAWSQEQLASLASLQAQVRSSGIQLLGQADPAKVGPSGLNHGAVVEVSLPSDYEPSAYKTQVTLSVALSGAAAGQKVSFQWTAATSWLDGSQTSDPVTVELTADENGSAAGSITVTLPKPGDIYQWGKSGYLTTFVQLTGLTNALFSNGRTAMTLPVVHFCVAVGTYNLNAHNLIMTELTEETVTYPNPSAEFDLSCQEKLYYGVKSGALDTVRLTAPKASTSNPFTPAPYGGISVPFYDGLFFEYAFADATRTEEEKSGSSAYIGGVDIAAYVNGHLLDIEQIGFPTARDMQTNDWKGPWQSPDTEGTPLTSDAIQALSASSNFTLTFEGGRYTSKFTTWNCDTNPETGKLDYQPTSAVTYDDRISVEAQLVFTNEQPPTVDSITAPAGEYQAGQVIPVVVTFSEPVNLDSARIRVNGTELTSQIQQTGDSRFDKFTRVAAFPYTVQEGDSASLEVDYVYAVDGAYNASTITNQKWRVEGASIVYTPAGAIDGLTAALTGTVESPALSVSVPVVDDADLTVPLTDYLAEGEGGAGFTTLTEGTDPQEPDKGTLYILADSDGDGAPEKYPLKLEGEDITGGTLTASIPLPINTGAQGLTHVVELCLDGQVVMGRYASCEQTAFVPVTAEDVTSVSLSVQSGGQPYVFESADSPVIYLQSGAPDIRASFDLESGSYTFGDKDKVTTADAGGTFADPSAHFAWQSSDPGVAVVAADGTVTPTGMSGSTTISLIVGNGDVSIGGVSQRFSAAASYPVYVAGDSGAEPSGETSEALTFAASLTPFLSIANGTISSVSGQPVTVYWQSNLCEKNGDMPTSFHVTVTRGQNTVLDQTYEGTRSAPVSSVTIPGEHLTYDYQNGQNTFHVTVSASYGGSRYTASAAISLESQPAVVELSPLDSYYRTDTDGAVDIAWTVSSFDRYDVSGAGAQFELRITGAGVDEVKVTKAGESTGGGGYSGSYTLNIPDVAADPSDPASYRRVYTVTVQAKNGADSTWSYDSFLLYVYDGEALDILVNGQGTDGSHIMSNRDYITTGGGALNSGEWQDWVIGLQRDIYLKDIISVNYGTYAWTEVADQIQWAVQQDQESVSATLNYQQGALYDNIDSFSYVSYRPATEFGLAGLRNGSLSITATHKLAGMNDTLDVTVETLEDRLYLFQCYPQVETKLTFEVYTDDAQTATRTVELTSDSKGAAAYYAQFGIASDIHCRGEKDGLLYLGTIYRSSLASGEGDWTQSQRYPVNNLNLRRAAYAYLYLKDPEGKPYTGSVSFRGGVYVGGEYAEDAKFNVNQTGEKPGDGDNSVTLSSNGRLEVVMDTTQWGLEGELTHGLDVSYVFQITAEGNDSVYPLLVTIDSTVNQDAYVSSGEAVVSFRANPDPSDSRHPFVIAQSVSYGQYGGGGSVLDTTGKVGPNSSLRAASLSTVVMWWGRDIPAGQQPSLRLVTQDGIPVSDGAGEATLSNTAYPFLDVGMTQYTVRLDEGSLAGVLESGRSVGLYLDYYPDGQVLSRRETLPFQLCNLLEVVPVEQAPELPDMLQSMGQFTGTDASQAQGMDLGDSFVNTALNLVAGDEYTGDASSAFTIQLAPTSDPTKFLGLIAVNIGGSDRDEVEQKVLTAYEREADVKYTPGRNELMTLTGLKSFSSYFQDQIDEINQASAGQAMRDLEFAFGGYAESLIYYDQNTGRWQIQILSGGFHAGGGASYSWFFNTWCGPVPFTATLTVGGNVQVSMDALTVASYNTATGESGLGTDFLTELRLYLYLRFFAGVGFDYSVVAFKLGVYGQIDLTMRFQWLNRPYMADDPNIANVADGRHTGNLNGQNLRLDGEIGLEFIVKFLFLSYDKILLSAGFHMADQKWNDWEEIQTSWAANQAAKQQAIEGLLRSGNATLSNVAGQQMLSLNLAPTLESREYLNDPEDPRSWMYGIAAANSLDSASALAGLETNSYPYSNPVVSDDGSIVAYLSDMGSSDVELTRAAYAAKDGGGAYVQGGAIDGTSGYGDSQLALAGTGSFAVATWTRQMETIQKDAVAFENGKPIYGYTEDGAPIYAPVLTEEDQMAMLNSTEVFASVYEGSGWSTVQLSGISGDGGMTVNGTPDLAPVVAVSGDRAIVAWRSVAASGEKAGEGDAQYSGVTNFDQKDTILYKVYEDGSWSEAHTLYNGTSGAVKGIVAAMLDDGTAAVAYTLDTDQSDATITDREIVYAVIDRDDDSVSRNVRATTNDYLDENPQLAAVSFEGEERFVLGWYTEQSVATDSASVLDGSSGAGEQAPDGQTVSDIRLLDFDAGGSAVQYLPDAISQVASDADVSITSNFRFTKNAQSIEDLSILWVERAEGTVRDLTDGEADGAGTEPLKAERDVLKGIKFYLGENGGMIRFTGALDVADMSQGAPDGTLIDWFDAYVSDAGENQIKAVILGTTYGERGVETQTVTLADGSTTARVALPSRETCMYTATAAYTDRISVTAVLADYDTVRLDAETQIQFTVKNEGIHAIDSLTITLRDPGESGTAKETNVDLSASPLLPGQSATVYAGYQVPGDKVVDPAYTVKANFSQEGAAGRALTARTVSYGLLSETEDLTQATGTIYLDLPDVEITQAAVVKEEEGQRTIQVKLNNTSDATLAGHDDGRYVKLSFYTDATCQTPIPASYFEGGSGTDPFVIDIREQEALSMLDEGGYAAQVVFHVGDFVKGGEDAQTEIPDSGVIVYLKAEVYAPSAGGTDLAAQGEPDPYDNRASVTCENLQVRSGEEVSLTGDLAVDGAGNASVTVTLQNNRLGQKATGNLIVTLLDADNNVLKQTQSYTGQGSDNGLLTLKGEEITTKSFSFGQVPGACSVRVTYSDAVLDDLANTSLDHVTLEGVALTYDPDTRTYSGSADSLFSALLTIVPQDPRASVTVNGVSYAQPVNQALSAGTNRIAVTVSSADQSASVDYTIVVDNHVSSSGGGSSTSYPVSAPADTERGTVTVSPERARSGQTVTITAKPDAGYQVGTVTVTKANGDTVRVTSKGGGLYTFTMPSGRVTVDMIFIPEGQWANPFADVPAGAWYYDAVRYVSERGLMAGTASSLFSPDATLTRAMVVQILWAMEDKPQVNYLMEYADVAPDAWYAEAVRWAASERIVAGYSDTAFGPNDPVTREQLALILYGYARHKGWDVTARAGLSGYADQQQIASYAIDGLKWAIAEGLISGTSGTTLSPAGQATRAQVAVILTRFCQNIEK